MWRDMWSVWFTLCGHMCGYSVRYVHAKSLWSVAVWLMSVVCECYDFTMYCSLVTVKGMYMPRVCGLLPFG